jgi:acyl-CoA thioester hydrolase
MNDNAVETTFRVRYAETDQMGIVHHATYIVWFEEARSAMMRAWDTHYTNFEADGFFLIVTEVHARYLAPAHYDRLVTVRSSITELRSRSMTVSYEVIDTETNQLLATGHSKQLCVDRQGQVTKIPEEWYEFFCRNGLKPRP